MSIQEEEDEIIEEVDVYFCGELNDELAVLQYPLRPSDRFYGDYGDLSAVTVNKENMNVKFIFKEPLFWAFLILIALTIMVLLVSHGLYSGQISFR